MGIPELPKVIMTNEYNICVEAASIIIFIVDQHVGMAQLDKR